MSQTEFITNVKLKMASKMDPSSLFLIHIPDTQKSRFLMCPEFKCSEFGSSLHWGSEQWKHLNSELSLVCYSFPHCMFKLETGQRHISNRRLKQNSYGPVCYSGSEILNSQAFKWSKAVRSSNGL